ncbi:MAG: RdgB/HAM1 family non-canonical purine NTP pyrophosphatase [Clostridia bacterium]|nr:RdgB/HAM1 family non-canonical purine NTP pyrophosphatase [Clostridia bacterium]MBO7250461.1 RdgB/HAM1 family non-canonical purine NTP pyrophosphatase [Clostridia bacterium]
MKIVLASRNKKKIKELQALLGEYIEGIEILSLDDVGIYTEIEENGESFEENALIKASAAATSGYIGVGDDSGLAVDALGGAPGIYSARYSGEHGDDAANNELLLRNLEGVEQRSARFVSAIACVFPDGSEPICVRGTAEGEILKDYRGQGGFGYDPLFYFPSLDKTFGELTAEEKNKVSHRSVAIKLLAEALRERI